MRLTIPFLTALLAAAWLCGAPDPALAYMGPGLGLGVLSTALGVVGALFLGLVSILWYPFKRLLRRLRPARAATTSRTRRA